MGEFQLVSEYAPAGDQPDAIDALCLGLDNGRSNQTLLGVTGSGKTFTVANVIERQRRPALVISHNKTLAAQLYAEFKAFFPHNAVEYFVSYFDYYQPEAYIPRTDTYIEKDSSVNDEIERLRLSTMSSLFARRDVIVVASVSCIYGIGSREDYEEMLIHLRIGDEIARETLLSRLIDLQYARKDIELERGHFRVRGDVVELCPAAREDAIRIEFFGDEIDRMTRFDPLTGQLIESLAYVTIYPGKQFVAPREKTRRAIESIKEELAERVAEFEKQGKLLEAQRIKMRTEFDLEMMSELGYCSGIENYSRHLSGRPPGSTPCTLMEFFPEDSILVIDESHVTIPQVEGMYAGDRSRKMTLVEHGFRLPSALDNRPLNFKEFRAYPFQVLFVSATPAAFELKASGPAVVEQIVRPTGLVDPEVEIRPLKGQIDDLIEEIRIRAERKERILVTTLTKKTAEELTDYLRDIGVRVRYLHSEIDAIERVEILRGLRLGEFDTLVGINLLREGLDIPEVSLVAVLDADKEGFLRSTTSLIQTAGRAARNLDGRVILYADVRTRSIKGFLQTSEYRREKQVAYNLEHGITPRSVARAVENRLSVNAGVQEATAPSVLREGANSEAVAETIDALRTEMVAASRRLEFEKAALLRDQIAELERLGGDSSSRTAAKDVTYVKPKRKASKKRGRSRKAQS